MRSRILTLSSLFVSWMWFWDVRGQFIILRICPSRLL
jgi:hypothetical protein